MPVAREGGPARDEHGRPTPIETRRAMIECRDVHKYYGDYHALRGIDLTIREAEFFSLLGPSGCGKTTLLRIIAGLETPDVGSIHFSGEDTTDVHVRERNVGFEIGRASCRERV